MSNPEPITVTVGLPVEVTFYPYHGGSFVAITDLAEFADAVNEAALGAADADAEAIVAAWEEWLAAKGAHAASRIVATAGVQIDP